MNWQFPEAPDTLALTVRPVLQGRPILMVQHDENGGWHFYDGRSVFSGDEMVLYPLKDIVTLDPSMEAFADLPKNWQARRWDAWSSWARESMETKEETRRKAATDLAELERQRASLPLTPPNSTELLREDRDR